MSAIVISSFFSCGKEEVKARARRAHYRIWEPKFANFQQKCAVINGRVCMVDEDAPFQQYAKAVKTFIDLKDFIFVEDHPEIRKALEKENVDFVTVYPDESLLDEWIKRLRYDGYDKELITCLTENWEFIMSIEQIQSYGSKLYRLKRGQQIVDIIGEIANDHFSKKSRYERLMK